MLCEAKLPFLLSLISYLLSGNDNFREERRKKREKMKEQKETTIFCRKLSFLFGAPGRISLLRLRLASSTLGWRLTHPCWKQSPGLFSLRPDLLKVRILPFYRKAIKDIQTDVLYCWRAWQDKSAAASPCILHPRLTPHASVLKTVPRTVFFTPGPSQGSNPSIFVVKQKRMSKKDIHFCWRAWQDSNLRPTGS